MGIGSVPVAAMTAPAAAGAASVSRARSTRAHPRHGSPRAAGTDRYGRDDRWNDRGYAVSVRDGCPADLIARGDGCYARGTVQRLAGGDGWASWYPVRYGGDPGDWGYAGGNLYRYGDGGSGGGLGGLGSGLAGSAIGGIIAAVVPLLGGSLFGGNTWPQQYDDYQVPAYYDRFYGSGYDGDYDYRYADDAVFAVDPQSNRIDSIAGLLTGDGWAVGERMPRGTICTTCRSACATASPTGRTIGIAIATATSTTSIRARGGCVR
ncbi:hypothetical protein AB5I41_19560 [Sphingomonas sp. MMS24-JH45]